MGRKVLENFTFSPAICRAELKDYDLLLTKSELSEKHDILPFFESHDHLSALVGMLNRSIGRIDKLGHEYDIFGDFRCDLVIGYALKYAYILFEFEDARK